MSLLDNKWIALALQISPFILAAKGVNPQVVSVVSNGIVEAEALKASGSITDKLGHVVNLANQTFTGINTVHPGAIKDVDAANAAVIAGVNTVVATLNAVHPKSDVTIN